MSLEIRNINKAYKSRKILSNVSFKCNSKDIIGILGRNGTGKSTLMKILFGTEKFDNGEILIEDKHYAQKEIIPNKKIAYLPQESFLPKQIKVRNIIPFFLPDGDLQDKVFYSRGIHSFSHKNVGNLSLGQLRYLEMLLVGNLSHPFLLLDEPFSMIEPIYKEYIKEFLLQLKNEKGIILTDHYYHDVLEVTNKNFLIKDGRFIPINSTEDLLANNYINRL